MPVYVSDLFTATPAPVNATPTSTRTWQWLRGSSAISGATSDTYTAVTADIGSTLSATQLETNFLATTTATSAATEVVQAFDPIRLFSASEPGVWYDPTDMSTLYQNSTGTIPVTSFGQPVGLMLDKSRGLVLGPEVVVNGSFATDTDWVKDAGWTIGGGVLSYDGTDAPNAVYQPAAVLASGKSYRVSITVSLTQGALLVRPQFNSVTGQYQINSSGTYSLLLSGQGASFGLIAGNAGGRFIGSIDNISVKELPGLHATQSTDASRPLYGIVPVSGRRNLLTQTEAFNEAVWTKVNATLSSSTLTATAANGNITQSITVPASSSFFVEVTKGTSETLQVNIDGTAAGRVSYNLDTKTVVSSGSNMLSPSIVALDNGNLRLSATVGAVAGIRLGVVIPNSGETVGLVRAQLETGSTPTPYQRVSTDLDVTEAGVASVGYLRFDGSTSFMVTPTITPGTDKVQVFAGVRKLSDAAGGALAETSTNYGTFDGTFIMLAPDTALSGYRFGSSGSVRLSNASVSGFSAPVSSVVTGLGDISGDIATLRANGTQVAQSTADQGTGNYLAYPMYIGRRAGTSLPFNGHLFPLIVRFGPTLTAARIAATEAWVATKTGGVTL